MKVIIRLIRLLIVKLRLESFLSLLTRGKEYNAFICRFIPQSQDYKRHSTRLINDYGINLKVNLDDFLGHFIFFKIKDHSFDVMINLIKPQSVVLDIGTNIGHVLLNFAKKVGDEGRVYGFEPDPYNFKMCQENISLNRFTNLQVENIALGNIESDLHLVIENSSNRGENKILDINDIKDKESSLVKVKKLDQWAEEKNLSRIDFIKIDTEGYELNVLMGGKELIKRFRPTIFIEVIDENLKRQHQSASDLISFLIDLDYVCYDAISKKQVTKQTVLTNCAIELLAKSIDVI